MAVTTKKQKPGTVAKNAATSSSKKTKKPRKVLVCNEIKGILDKLVAARNYGICEICNERVGTAAHHYFSKGAFPHMKYELNNLMWVCFYCHIRKIHQQGQHELAHDTIINIIGEDSFLKLKRDAYQYTKRTIKYYDDLLEYLKSL